MFYGDGAYSAFRYVATPASMELVTRKGFLIRPVANGVSVFADYSLGHGADADADDQSKSMLAFKIFPEDPYFTQYTLPVSKDADALPYFQSDRAWLDDDGRWRLHEQDYVVASALQEIGRPPLAPHLGRRDALIRPGLVVAVSLASGAAAGSRHYYLRFSARKSFWKYYLFSEADEKNFSIVDLDNHTRFECTGPVTLSGNKRALVFLSDVEIEMRQKYAQRFQLREHNGMGEKVLIRRLPNASVSRVDLEGKAALVSEIYIN